MLIHNIYISQCCRSYTERKPDTALSGVCSVPGGGNPLPGPPGARACAGTIPPAAPYDPRALQASRSSSPGLRQAVKNKTAARPLPLRELLLAECGFEDQVQGYLARWSERGWKTNFVTCELGWSKATLGRDLSYVKTVRNVVVVLFFSVDIVLTDE